MTEDGGGGRRESAIDGATLEALLDFLGPDRHEASEKYRSLHRRLCRLLEWRGARYPEELADEVMNRMARRLATGLEVRVADPYRYLSGIAYRVLHEEYREIERSRRLLGHAVEAVDRSLPTPEEQNRKELRMGCLESCLAALNEESRRLILDYYRTSGDKLYNHRRQLAEELGISGQALRLKTHRIRLGLESCVSECMEGNER